MTSIKILYASSKLLMTLDLHQLFTELFDRFGHDLRVEIQPMPAEEVKAAVCSIDGIKVVKERFQVIGPEGKRYFDVEESVVSRGQK